MQKNQVTVLMVYPEFPASFWSFKESVELMNLKATMPPTGLATVAAMLPSKHFKILPIIDLNVETMTESQVENADVVMISAMIAQKDSLRSVIALAKRLGKIVMVGGPYATSYREDVLSMGADHLVLNEAELTLPSFVADFIAGQAKQIYDEKSVGTNDSVTLTREGKPLLVTTPIPRWDLLNLSVYSSVAVQYSRGCPFNCDFCDITTLFGHQPRTKAPEQMIAELEAILETGWRGSVFVVDDNFIGNRAQVREFLSLLVPWQKKHNYPFSFYTEASVDLANNNMRDIREQMIAAGFTDVFCGIESTNLDVLAGMNKGQNKGDLGQKVATLQRAGFEVTAGFIVGNDSDTNRVFDELFQFIQENGIVIPMPGLLTALKGTALYRRMVAEGRLRTESLGNNTHQFKTNFEPKLDETFLIDGYVNLLKQLFTSKNYYERCRTLRQRRGKNCSKGRVNGAWFKATLRVFYRNLIKRPDLEFAKFMLGTILTSPFDLPRAVTQAVKFEHFRKITHAAVSAHYYPKRVETLLEKFRKKVDKLKMEMDVRIREHKLAKLEKRTLAKGMKRYRALDPHFRRDARAALARFHSQLRDCAERYKRQWRLSDPVC